MKVHGFDFSGNPSDGFALTGGVAFPVSPTSGEVYYRSDYNCIYRYDGTDWRAVGIPISTVQPSFAEKEGELFYRSDTNVLTYYDGSAWISMGTVSTATNSVLGISKLSVAASDPASPVVVGSNDTRVLTSAQKTALTTGATTNADSYHTHSSLAVGTVGSWVSLSGLAANTYRNLNTFSFTPSYWILQVKTTDNVVHQIPASRNEVIDVSWAQFYNTTLNGNTLRFITSTAAVLLHDWSGAAWTAKTYTSLSARVIGWA